MHRLVQVLNNPGYGLWVYISPSKIKEKHYYLKTLNSGLTFRSKLISHVASICIYTILRKQIISKRELTSFVLPPPKTAITHPQAIVSNHFAITQWISWALRHLRLAKNQKGRGSNHLPKVSVHFGHVSVFSFKNPSTLKNHEDSLRSNLQQKWKTFTLKYSKRNLCKREKRRGVHSTCVHYTLHRTRYGAKHYAMHRTNKVPYKALYDALHKLSTVRSTMRCTVQISTVQNTARFTVQIKHRKSTAPGDWQKSHYIF